MLRRFTLFLFCPLIAVFSLPGHAQAEENWPTEPIKLIVAYPPGGSTDTAARLLAKQLSTTLDQTVLVENRSGAGGTIGAGWVARAKPDGHTILMAASPEVSIAPVVMPELSYNPSEDFKPISLVGQVPFVLATNPELPVTSVQELIDHAKANPGKLNYSSFGANTSNHLIGEQFKVMADIRTTHVPYKGSGPSIIDLIGGEVHYTFDTVTATLGHIEAGRLRAIAVATPERLDNAPSIPTISESGWPGFVAGTWFGLLAPAGTSDEVIDRLNSEVHAALASEEINTKFTELNIIPSANAPREFGDFIKSENQRWQDLTAQFDPSEQ